MNVINFPTRADDNAEVDGNITTTLKIRGTRADIERIRKIADHQITELAKLYAMSRGRGEVVSHKMEVDSG